MLPPHLSQLSSLPPISRLPPELLIDIFTHCSDEPSDQLTPVLLGHVCQYWKDVSLLSPRIWQHIYLYERNGTFVSHEQARWWIAKSNPLPFDVRIEAETTDMILPLLSPVLSHMQRLERCVISGRHNEEFDFTKYPFDRARPCLVNELNLVIKGVAALDTLGLNADSDVSEDRPETDIFRVHSPSDGPPELSLHFAVYALPLQLEMKPILIKALCITEYSMDVTVDIPRLIRFLQCTPFLESLHYTGWPQEGDPILPGHLSMARLPCLRVLLIRTTVSVRAILSNIDVPALEELYLEHTNVDFELRTEPYVAQQDHPDEGESEDEAHDFSQSPCSDHATGMGLRMLLKRSRPPLQVLHMDYADMRTKDFRWCFDHLKHLREFRIVGSDMSDRVVALLAPFQRPFSGPHQGQGGGTVHVRLPCLQHLAFWHCQRVTGDAIVRALRERVELTDYLAENGWGETLEGVAVVGCVEVLFQHVQALSETLGERLRIS
ncbi:hypothetical protein L226DRAFT_532695 [Lentinus tigrinus ALCF2SS1-7]|uniref:F-box domain-containing protein n=1 Tax=Lentinus tigrinus ALCF2SS1-6 TaxID=1328759 RepID=A0A5C2SEX1_9APHY|nr:hypothetical protein L227DRAFT_573487 [Lentinus tigrinus ALCF2SS1-6]RPD77940.1 hypothetical protein L226DRAFT_532695 [Lentinus tigrinus ALCF2SS1-7]